MKNLNKNRKGYKHTSVGWIPEDWNVKPIKELVEINSNSLNGKTEPDFSFYYLDLSSIEEGKISLPTEQILFKNAPSRARRLLKENDIIMSTVRPNLRSFAIANFDSKNFVCSTGFAILSPKIKEDSLYIYQNLFSHNIWKQIENLVVGSNYPALNNDDVENLFIPYPVNDKERFHISKFLSTWDKAIETTQKLIIEKEQLKKGLMHLLLTGNKRLPGFNGEWKSVRLGDVTRNFSRRNKNGVDAKVYSVTNYDGFVLQSEHFNREIAGEDLSNYKIIKKGEFAYNPARVNVGSIAQFKEEIGIISSLYVCFSPNENINDVFLRNFLQLDKTKHYIDRLGEGGVRVYLWYPLFAKIKIELPSIEEQNTVANIFTTHDQEINLLKSQLELYRQQKKGLMQVLLTGAVRVKV